MNAVVDPLKQKIAKQSAKLFLTQMVSVPGDVQLMAVEMLAKTIFMTSIVADKRLQLLDAWLRSIRDAVKDDLNPKKKATTNGKQSRH